MRTGVSQTAYRIYDPAVDGDAVGVFAVVELRKFDQAVKADDLHQDPDRTIAGQDPCPGTDMIRIGMMEDRAKIKIFIDQLTGEN